MSPGPPVKRRREVAVPGVVVDRTRVEDVLGHAWSLLLGSSE